MSYTDGMGWELRHGDVRFGMYFNAIEMRWQMTDPLEEEEDGSGMRYDDLYTPTGIPLHPDAYPILEGVGWPADWPQQKQKILLELERSNMFGKDTMIDVAQFFLNWGREFLAGLTPSEVDIAMKAINEIIDEMIDQWQATGSAKLSADFVAPYERKILNALKELGIRKGF